MIHDNTNELPSLANEEMHSYDGVNEYLSKAMALSQITMHDDFLNYSDGIIHDYLWTLSEMVEKAYEHCQSLLSCFTVSANSLGTEPVSTQIG